MLCCCNNTSLQSFGSVYYRYCWQNGFLRPALKHGIRSVAFAEVHGWEACVAKWKWLLGSLHQQPTAQLREVWVTHGEKQSGLDAQDIWICLNLQLFVLDLFGDIFLDKASSFLIFRTQFYLLFGEELFYRFRRQFIGRCGIAYLTLKFVCWAWGHGN